MRGSLLLVLLAFLLSCDERTKQNPAPPPAPTRAPQAARAEPASTPVIPPAVIRIASTRVEFAPARLEVKLIDGKVTARFHSGGKDDANSFDIPMELNAEDVAHFAEAEWRYTTAATELQDSP